jgi:hypothetical protein
MDAFRDSDDQVWMDEARTMIEARVMIEARAMIEARVMIEARAMIGCQVRAHQTTTGTPTDGREAAVTHSEVDTRLEMKTTE